MKLPRTRQKLKLKKTDLKQQLLPNILAEFRVEKKKMPTAQKVSTMKEAITAFLDREPSVEPLTDEEIETLIAAAEIFRTKIHVSQRDFPGPGKPSTKEYRLLGGKLPVDIVERVEKFPGPKTHFLETACRFALVLEGIADLSKGRFRR